MPKKKQKLNKRIDTLFEGIKREEAPARPDRLSRVPRESKKQTTVLKPIPFEPKLTRALKPAAQQAITQRVESIVVDKGTQDAPASLSLAFPLDQTNWATIHAISNDSPHTWSSDEQLLVKQVTDQLSLALENAHLFQETQQRADELAALNRIVSSASQILDIQQLFTHVLQQTLDIIGLSGGLVSLFDDKTGTLKLSVHQNLPEPMTEWLTKHGLGGTPCEHVFNTQETLAINDLRDGAPVDVSGLITNGIYSYLGVPLFAKGRALGTICMFNSAPKVLEPRLIDLAQSIGIQVGFAIENARLFRSVEDRAEELAVINRVVTKASASLDIQKNLLDVAEEINRALSLGVTTIAFFVPEREAIIVMAEYCQSGAKTQNVIGSVHPLPSNPILRSIIENHKTVIITDVPHKPLPQTMKSVTDQEGTLTLAIVPIISKGEVMGMVGLHITEPNRPFTQNEITLTETICSQIATAVENAHLFEETQTALRQVGHLYDASRAIAIARNDEDVFTSVVETLDRTNLDRIVLAAAEKHENEFQAHVKSVWDRFGMESRFIDNRFTPRQIPAITKTMDGSMLIVEDFGSPTAVDDTTRTAFQYLGVKSAAILPIFGQTLLGWLLLETTQEKREFTEQDIRPYLTLTRQMATAIENTRLFQEVQQLNQAIQSSNDSIVTTGLDGNIIQVNAAFTKMTGYLPEEVIGKTPRILNSGHQSKEFYAQLWATILAGDIWQGEIINKRKDGSLYTVDQTILPVRNNQGVLIGFMGLERDITESKQAQEALARSEADLRALFSSMEDVVLVVDQDGRYVRIAPTNPSRLIRPPEELLGKLMEDVMPRETALRLKEAVRQTLETGKTTQMEYELPIGDERVWFLASLSKLDEGLVFWVARDITERKRNEQILSETEERLRLIVETVPVPILISGVDDGIILFANDQLGSAFGTTKEELVGHQTPDFYVNPGDRRPMLEQLRHDGFLRNYELAVKKTDGSPLWMLVNMQPLSFGGRPALLTAFYDVTERKKAEENLARFKLGIENSGDAIFMTDINGNIIYANPAFETVYGHKSQEVIGKNPRIIQSGLMSKEQYKDFWNTLLAKQTITGEIVNRRKDGRLVSIAGTNSPILDEKDNILGFLAVHHDITDRKRAEDALQRRNAYLAASAEISRLITSTLDLNTLFTRTVNLVIERFGYYHAAIFIVEETGFNANLQEATGEAGRAMKERKHSLPVGSTSIVGEATQNGQAIVVNNTAFSSTHKPNPLLPETKAEIAIPLRVGNRNIGALDIQSTQVDAFSEDDIAVLQSLADQIAIAIDNARSYELSVEAVKEMREIDRMKTQFLANMSHELRTPLNSIIGFSRVILKGIDGPITELQQSDLTAIYNSGQHLLGLINDILDLSKIEAGKMELAFDEVNLPDVINSVMSTAVGLVKDKPIRLVKNISDDLPHVNADPIRIRQVLINLFSNAAKFTDEGEITVSAVVENSQAGQPEVLISVTDTGPGIDEKDQGKLFQPFSQVDDSPTRKTGGTGLGLSITQRLVHMHGGEIGVHSAPGQGSTFYFTLPIYHQAAEITDGSGRLVLAIDDDPQVISLYERYLKQAGYEVLALTDPSKAVQRVTELKPFAVTLDIMMPGYDGWQVLTALKSNPETRETPVIICSIIEEQERGFNLGAADYLVKPILEEDMVQALNRLNTDGSIQEVLVIDDDPNDLNLMGKMLNDQGRYKPTLAQGGGRGWEILTTKPPQAVILDLFMPEMDGFKILERMHADRRLSEIPVIVVSGGDLTAEQHKQLTEFGQHLISKSALSDKELIAQIEHALKRIKPR